MEIKLKQRLIGAIVIIAIAVILIPMILDGSGKRGSIEPNVKMPPEPEFVFESDLPSTTKLDELPISREPDMKPTPAEEEVRTGVPRNADQAVANRAVEATADHVEADPSLGSWVVQIGAFGEESKALALQERLRAGDYPAFTEWSKDGGEMIYRVKVGPDLSREKAEKLRIRLAKEYSLPDGIFVTSHP